MIYPLENANEQVASQIYKVFQHAYKVEAELIGAVNFPPLSRSTIDIASSKTLFYGFQCNDCLAAVIEISINEKRLEIDSLTVDPQYFRKGIAGRLIEYVLDTFEYSEAVVETAVVNEPAIILYKKHGFVEYKRWIPSHGIPKIAMLFKSCDN
ncbi:MAG: N-acetyltransferase [Paraglaciecola sp.]|uniref:GNAT family N-acetyltransferase n=1 Tax=Paraglaciecola sp. TaxID=1920173 RepID=UPI0032986399